MIILVSSPKQHLPKDMQNSVYNIFFIKFCSKHMEQSLQQM